MFIKVKVTAEAKRDEIKKIKDDHFTVATKSKAEQNRANKRTLELVAKYYKIPPNKVRIISGHHRPNKILEILE